MRNRMLRKLSTNNNPSHQSSYGISESIRPNSSMPADVSLTRGFTVKGAYVPIIREDNMGGAKLTGLDFGAGLGQGFPAQILAVARVAGNVAQKPAIGDRRRVGLIGPGRCLPGHHAENHDQPQSFIDRIIHDARPSL